MHVHASRGGCRPRSVRPAHRVPPPGILPLLLVLLVLAPLAASAQALDANAWVTDGDVNVIAPWGNTVYIGGDFSYVGPNTGGWVELDGVAHATNRLPRLDGDVSASVSDGAGGWYVAGSFTHVAGIARPGLARVLADGSLSTWTPSPAPGAGDVVAVEHQGTRLFVATFTGSLLAYDDATGNSIGSWAPSVSGDLMALAVSGTTLFAAGDILFNITSPPGQGTGIAAINTLTGAIENFDPAPDGPVSKLRVDGRWLYAGGSFTTIGGQSHQSLARMLLSTRVFDAAFTPSLDSPAVAMATFGDGIWLGGGFFLVNNTFAPTSVAVIDTTTGANLPLVPDLTGLGSDIRAFGVRGTEIYVGLMPQVVFPVGGTAKPLVVRFRQGEAKPDKTWNALGTGPPNDDQGSVDILRFSPTGVIAMGHFVSAGGRRQVCAAALDRATGIPRPWDPALAVDDPFPVVPVVSSILPTSHGVYLGGFFTHAGGQLRKSLAAFDSANARIQPWTADLGPPGSESAGTAQALAVYQNRLVVGGTFSSVSSIAHANLALVDTATGVPVAGWTCDANGTVNAIAVRATSLFLGGTFSTVAGQARKFAAQINGGTAAVQAWNPNILGNGVSALAISSDTVYIGGDYSNAGGGTHLCLAAASATSGTVFGWAPAAFGPVRALALNGPGLVVGGEFNQLAGQPISFLGRVDRFTGGYSGSVPVVDDRVLAVAMDGGTLYAGGAFSHLGGSPTANLGRSGGADSAPPAVTVVAANGGETLVVGSTYRFEYAASDPSGVASVDLELSRAGTGGPWTMVAAGVRNTGHWEWTVTGPNVAANAFLRVTARDFGGNATNDRSNAAFTIGAATASVDAGAARVALTLGPNPAHRSTSLHLVLSEPTRARLRLLDVQGREVWSRAEEWFAAGEHVVPCELAGVAPGLYFMRFERPGRVETTRLAVFR